MRRSEFYISYFNAVKDALVLGEPTAMVTNEQVDLFFTASKYKSVIKTNIFVAILGNEIN